MNDVSSLPKFAIVGRPNVGKSTLFNVLVGGRKAVVKNLPGVTRDIHRERAEWCSTHFEVWDTGGLTEAEVPFASLIFGQVKREIQNVDGLILVMDGRSGLCHEDRDVFRLAKESKKPFVIVVNKLDQEHKESIQSAEFFEFGEDILPCSFERRRGLDTLMEWILFQCSQSNSSVPASTDPMTLALIGKPNVGKSSMVNLLLGEDRMVVSPIAGTTVDAIDSEFERDGKQYKLIDTAGLRRKARRVDDLEILASFKTRDGLSRADVVLLMVDGTLGPTDQDAKLTEMILEHHKAIILVANKLDKGEAEIPEFRKKFREQTETVFHFFPDIPIVFTSAVTGSGIQKLFEVINHVWSQLHIRIPTSQLNDFFFDVIRKAPAPVSGTSDVKFYYLTQTRQVPPSFIAFANDPDGVHKAYRRFLIKNIKDRWSLQGIPVRLFSMQSGGTIIEGKRDR